jgi:uncharacterized protein
MKPNHNVVGWFEIPVTNMDRAVRFYERLFDYTLERHTLGPLDMAWFPVADGTVGSMGSLVHAPGYYTPSDKGTLVYFTAFSGDLDIELSQVEPAGGKILQKKTLITEEIGYMALVLDSEGNRIALHSRQ